MKSTISGFNQEYALTLKKQVPADKTGKTKTIQIDCTDLAILRWLVDFYPSMKKITVAGREYAWLTHKKLMEDMPLLDISKRGCMDRMQKLVEFGVLDYKLLKDGGTFSLYAFGKNYINLVQSSNTGYAGQPSEGMQVNQQGVCGSSNTGYAGQPADKDNSIKDKSIKDISYIVEYLNKKAGKKFKASSKDTRQHINARLAEGYKLEDFVEVIDKRCAVWKGDPKMEEFLRPSTLFGPKFESYLNAPAPAPARPAGRGYGTPAGNIGPNGIAIDNTKTDLDGLF